jgi:hypothetical protein
VIHRVDLWFAALARRGAKRLWLRNDDLAAEGDGLREVWLPSQVFISRRFEERQNRQMRRLIEAGVWNEEEQYAIASVMAGTDRPWRLYYDRKSRKSKLRQGAHLLASRAALAEAVTEAREFSRLHRIGYVGAFSKALSALGSRRPSAPYHVDMLPPVGYSLDVRQLLAAATHAWVFGGMGSWGDVLFEDRSVETRFWRLYDKLGNAVVSALLAATNSFDGSQDGRKAI